MSETPTLPATAALMRTGAPRRTTSPPTATPAARALYAGLPCSRPTPRATPTRPTPPCARSWPPSTALRQRASCWRAVRASSSTASRRWPHGVACARRGGAPARLRRLCPGCTRPEPGRAHRAPCHGRAALACEPSSPWARPTRRWPRGQRQAIRPRPCACSTAPTSRCACTPTRAATHLLATLVAQQGPGPDGVRGLRHCPQALMPTPPIWPPPLRGPPAHMAWRCCRPGCNPPRSNGWPMACPACANGKTARSPCAPRWAGGAARQPGQLLLRAAPGGRSARAAARLRAQGINRDCASFGLPGVVRRACWRWSRRMRCARPGMRFVAVAA